MVSPLDRLEEIATAQKAYHDRKQQEFPSLDDFLDEDGELHLPADIGPLLSQSSYNGRYSEADWWLSTIQKVKADASPAPQPKTAGVTSAEIEEAAAHCEHVASEYEARANDPNCNRDHYLRAAERKRQEAAAMRSRAAIIPPSETNLQGSQALFDVAAERQRQTGDEGWSPEHDNAHKNGELSENW